MNRLRNLFDSEEVVTAKQMSEDVVILIVAEDEDTIALRRHQKQEVEKLRKVLKQMERISIEYNLPQVKFPPVIRLNHRTGFGEGAVPSSD